MNRVTEVAAKLGRLLDLIETSGADGVRLRGSDWFAWATAGGSNVVVLASETGVAELLVTRQGAFVLTDEIEARRMRDEEIVGPITVWSHPWAQPEERERYVRELCPGRVVSDRPGPGEELLPNGALSLRLTLLDGESDRYRDVGARAARAVSEAMRAARPDMTEADLAAEGMRALARHGLEPALVMASGERRSAEYRHAVTKAEPLGRRAMLVVCARSYGMYASLTRFVSFGGLDDDLRERHRCVREVEAALWDASRVGARLDDLYLVAERAYAAVGGRRPILEHHQGGVSGYRARELLAAPGVTDVLEPNMVLAWNPSLPGAKIEDTALLHMDGRLENLTLDPSWPTVTAPHGERPDVLEL
ncbi:M24 family metallopeptidase [Deinococcus pimensis]|uniref:M24 family metallopeptidase n=1 Tax=Deinococcus pimensis TaxID=309888 RepID=UPI000481D04C|nr:M24 family metallopeptidase [Deinococcus pimensis]